MGTVQVDGIVVTSSTQAQLSSQITCNSNDGNIGSLAVQQSVQCTGIYIFSQNALHAGPKQFTVALEATTQGTVFSAASVVVLPLLLPSVKASINPTTCETPQVAGTSLRIQD
jgi:hypothetical protein